MSAGKDDAELGQADGTSADELKLVAALRRGDEAAFMALVELYQPAMLRVARMYLADRAAAEEAVQEAWLGVLRGLPSFAGRSSLKTWIFRIVANRAKTRATRGDRSIPFSALEGAGDAGEPAVDPERFLPAGHEWQGGWAAPPQSWDSLPESRLLAAETREQIRAAVAALPANQRAVIALRDIEGWSSQEVCNVLDIGETNQRVLLHRARAKVRSALERYLKEA
jgi:RNA polymerase sigma-70 factor (ECF subfamily)